ncbi:hypothetical protein RCJ22_14215, partial [Vibrio sp. FNV 38]|nr:hypothetical protein [Vibrio sp. FNV 38]
EDIDTLPASKTEKTEISQSRLKSFREKAQAKHCKFWTTPHDLGGKVSRSLVQLKKKHPSDGWVPGRYAVDTKMLRELDEMRVKIAELERELGQVEAPSGSENFAQGKDLFSCHANLEQNSKGTEKNIELTQSWDTIFSYCGSVLNGECTEEELDKKIKLCFWHATPEKIEKYNSNSKLIIPLVYFDKIKLQLQALGLITQGKKKRAVSDTSTYWQMTPYGKKHLMQISAIKT